MDADLWKQLVDKVISRTESRDLVWFETSEGPANTLSFGASIDDSTSLNIWGYKTNYSYGLRLTRQTAGDPFEEQKRVTTKKNAEGINFSGLFQAAQRQIKDLPRERAVASLMEYLADPTVKDPEKQVKLLEQWTDLGNFGYLRYFESEEILSVIKDMTTSGFITWASDPYGEEYHFFTARISDILEVTFGASQTPDKAPGATLYRFWLSGTDDESDLHIANEIDCDARAHLRPRRAIAHELNSLISKKIHEDEAKFNQIVRDDIFHDILASLDNPHKESSSVEEV